MRRSGRGCHVPDRWKVQRILVMKYHLADGETDSRIEPFHKVVNQVLLEEYVWADKGNILDSIGERLFGFRKTLPLPSDPFHMLGKALLRYNTISKKRVSQLTHFW